MTPQNPTPPVAEIIPHQTTIHGDTLVDNYYWLRERDNPAVVAYLEAENAYTDAMTGHIQALQETLYQEMVGRIKETDEQVPDQIDDYFYYSRTEEGREYPIYCRKRGSLSASEEIMFDQNELAADHAYCRLGVKTVSPNHRYLAFSVDTDGSESYTLHIKDLDTGQLLPDEIPNTYYDAVWANDNRTLFYTAIDEATRPYRLFRHTLGTDAAADTLIYEETDEMFFLGVQKTRSRAYILLTLHSTISAEVHVLEADQPTGAFRVVEPREPDHEYSLDHHGDQFYIVTNDQAQNFRLMLAPVSDPARRNWQELIPHRPQTKLDRVSMFANHRVLYEREQGLRTIRITNLSDGETHSIDFPEPVYTIYPARNPMFDTNLLRFEYTSLVTPPSVFDYDMTTKTRELKKQDEVLGGYDPAAYQSERIFASAPDGTQIAVSLVYKQGLQRNGGNPCLLVGYGSYGYSYDPSFSSERLSLLDRGFVCAIAHIRGGGEMGRPWYEAGKMLNKKNTFTDFIACAEHLIAGQYTSPETLAIQGGSAGGLLMGAVLNMRPELFKAAVAAVPFVDVVNTMLDPSIPLTVIEWEQWGNPNNPEHYAYIKTYSPYDNVSPTAYPHLLITAGLNDPRVQYWEPAKWTAKLRTLKTDDNLLLLKTEMGAGHGGPSGRYEALREQAFRYAFVLDRLGRSPLVG